VTWQGKRSVIVEEVPDLVIQEPTDAIIKITSSVICGSDLHLYEVLRPFMSKGNIRGHEPMGIVQEVGSKVINLKVGDRVVIPFNISCGHCFMCKNGLQSQWETTQVRAQGTGCALFGFSKLYGEVPGGQAEFLRVPHADDGPIVVPDGPSDDRFVYMSDVLPTAWQAVQYANIPEGGSVAVFGLGPIGDMATRVAKHLGAGQIIGIDLVPECLERAKRNGVTVLNTEELNDDELVEAIKELTNGRGVDSVIDAVGL
jgi:threonine dehydrogenase-like Zn-dependent dehydrogenase